MSKNTDDFFGGFFDFNGDGRTDIGEEWIGYQILDDIENSDKDGFESECLFTKPAKISAPISTPSVQSAIENKDCLQKETLDYNTYKKRKNSFLGDLWLSIIVCIALMVIPCGVVYAAVSSYDEKNSASVFVILLFIGLACFIAYAIIKAFSSFAKHDIDSINKLNEQFQETALPDEQSKRFVMRKRTKIVYFSLVSCILIGLITWGVISSAKLDSVYNEAINEIRAGNYDHAKSILEEIEDKHYKSTESLISICEACYHYEHNQKVSAYYDMKDVHLSGLTEDEQKKLDDFKNELSAEYKQYLSRSYSSGSSGKYSGRKPAMTKEEADRLRGTGYHGTRPGSVAENIELQAAQVKCKKCGYHSDNGSNSLCDYCQAEEKRNPSTSSSKSSTNSSKSYSYKPKTKTKESNSDPYNAKDYRNEEDFYYDHYDDFFDYYEAEDYYREHTK